MNETETGQDAPKTILVVDDDASIAESLQIALQMRGYRVIVARDGNQGLAAAEKENPDLVILDMMMPHRSGFLVLERLRLSRPVPTKVIMYTANEGSRHREYAVEKLGADDYILKDPGGRGSGKFGTDAVLKSVERLLGTPNIDDLGTSPGNNTGGIK